MPAKASSLLDTCVVYCGDNLEQLRKLPEGCVDLIYIDPPFNSTMMMRENCQKGFFVSFDYAEGALTEITRFWNQTKRVIIPLTVQDILDEQFAHKLA